MTVAAIDIGTNTVLLLVADYDGQTLKILRDEARITRLGEGLHREPKFLPEAQERTLTVLKEYRKIADLLGAGKIAAVGTAAFRKSKNSPEFIARVKKETGIQIDIISGEEEARLSYLSVTHDFGPLPYIVALDIGGGSTEIISKEGAIGLPLGTVVLTESIVHHDPPTEGEVERMEEEIDGIVGAGFSRPGPASREGRAVPTLVGLAGSVTTLSAIKQKLTVWDGAKVQGSLLTLEDIEAMISLFRNTTNREKAEIPGMVRGREDTILTGALIVRAVLKRLGLPELIVSDRGLRFGLLHDGSC